MENQRKSNKWMVEDIRESKGYSDSIVSGNCIKAVI